jgi:hypothetical protein
MDMDKIKIAIMAKILILVFLALAGYFIWEIFHRPTESKLETKSEQATVPSASKTNETAPFSQEKRIYMPLDETAPPFFENINETAKTVETKLKNEIDAVTQTAPAASSSINIAASTPNEIVLSLTNDEFRFLYPDAFIKSLVDAQSLFVKNIDPSYEPITNIETDSQVRLIEEKIVAALVSLNMLTGEETRRINTTIHLTLPKLQLAELKNRNSSLNYYFNFAPLAQSSSKKLFLSGLLEKFYVAFIPKSEAAVCGACHTSPECYQIGASSPLPGLSLFKAFCFCTGCYHGQGCLDFCEGQAAIFDPTTFICGCGL